MSQAFLAINTSYHSPAAVEVLWYEHRYRDRHFHQKYRLTGETGLARGDAHSSSVPYRRPALQGAPGS